MFKLGDGAFEVHLLNAGMVKVDPGGAFGVVPRSLWSRYQTPDEEHMIPMCLNCLLIRTDGKNILVDTGMGNKLDPKTRARWYLTHPHGTLLEGLARLGLQPSDIDMVINTHLHGDHCEMNTMFGADSIVPTFPNATYVVQRREYDEAMHPNERTQATYVSFNFEPVAAAGQYRFLDGDAELLPGLHAVVTPGHTPAHMAVHINTGDEHLFFPCDLATYSVHFTRLAWVTAYDVEPLVTIKTKRRWMQWAAENNPVIVFSHDVTMLAAHVQKSESQQLTLRALNADEGACYA